MPHRSRVSSSFARDAEEVEARLGGGASGPNSAPEGYFGAASFRQLRGPPHLDSSSMLRVSSSVTTVRKRWTRRC